MSTITKGRNELIITAFESGELVRFKIDSYGTEVEIDYESKSYRDLEAGMIVIVSEYKKGTTRWDGYACKIEARSRPRVK